MMSCRNEIVYSWYSMHANTLEIINYNVENTVDLTVRVNYNNRVVLILHDIFVVSLLTKNRPLVYIFDVPSLNVICSLHN